MLVQTDTRRRITLPPSAGIKPGDTVEVEVLEDGRIMLIPIEAVPKHQLWAWTSESKEAISHSLADARPSTVVTTAAEAEKMGKRWTDAG